jgi:excinuclease ABC subunit A
LGHSLADLSGGEAQRLKLVSVLEGREAEESLLLFDEPTLGLEIRDVLKLIQLLHKLRDQGCSIICIAHHCALMMSADWVVDLGPEGGRDGGRVVDQGLPLEVERRAAGYTGLAMQEYRRLVESRKAAAKPSKQKAAIRKGKAECVPMERGRSAERKCLSIKGAREHNLKNVYVEFPLGTMVGLVGVSGSGKSTVAKDIIHAESQHQFLSCLSPYARQFVNTLSRPDIDSISGLQPTIFVGQHQAQPSSFSTVGTISEINHYLRLLFSKIGQQYCTEHPEMYVGGGSPATVSDRLSEIRGVKIIRLLSPVVRKKKGAHKEVFLRAIELGIDEVRCDGIFGAPSKFIDALDKRVVHTIEYVVLKGHPQRLNKDLLTEAAAWGISLGEGEVIIDTNNGESSELFSVHRSCPKCHKGYPKLDPEDFSFSSRRGRCSGCSGTGNGKNGKECARCQGTRLHDIARNVKISCHTISDLCLMHPGRLISFLESLKGESGRSALIETLILGATARLRTLESLGLEYLSLSREGPTLSGGELQRLRLAAALASPLMGMMYIFDEPSIGLHPFDTEKVLRELRRLCDAGNSIVMIEHDAECIRSCDHIVEIGPGGGREGGGVVFNGSAEKFLKSSSTVTSRIIATLDDLDFPGTSKIKSNYVLSVTNGNRNNIVDLSVSIPLGAMTTVAGLSGSGKTSLVQGLIVSLIADGKSKEGKDGKYVYEGIWGRLQSDRLISKVICVDQKPIGLNSRSTPVSFLGIWDPIRQIFAQSIQAKSLGWNAGYFSYNTGNGRCRECRGQGELQLEMSFLPNARVECSTCRGSRFQDDVSEVKYLGKSIVDILAMTFDEARKFFINHRKILPVLSKVCDLGLGYLTLGQPAPSLSGGESQRLKLVLELSRRSVEGALFVFDEPTVGLHLADVSRLLGALRELVSNGATVIIVEHDAQVVLASDYVIEMGPGAGMDGGAVVFSGELKDLYASTSVWGELLRNNLKSKVGIFKNPHHQNG